MDDPKIVSRISLFYAIMLILGGLIIVQVVYLQFFAKDTKGVHYSEKSRRISISKQETKPLRGSILTYDNRLLAISVPSYVLRMDFKAKGMTDIVFNENVDALAQSLSNFFKDKSATTYKKELINARRDAFTDKGSRVRRIIKQKVDYFQLQEIKKFPLYKKGKNVGGLIVETENKRVYPYQGMAYRTIGYLNAGNAGTGIERSFNKYLSGIQGLRIIQRTAGGEFIPIESDDNIEPQDGCDIVTTLDVDIQDAAETALRNQLMKQEGYFEAGTAVVMETKTGEIRAMANMKRYSNGSFGEAYNYAIGEATEPGSTFKLASLIAAIEYGGVDIDDEIDCGESSNWEYKRRGDTKGHVFREAGSGLGKASVKKIIEKSSNIGVAKMVLKVFEKKESKFTDFLYSLNLNEKLNIEIEGEAIPFIKNPKTHARNWSAYSLPQMALGYELKLAPIHTLTLYNAVANNGRMVKPKLVNEIRRYGHTEQTFPTQVIKESICSRKTLRKVQEVLEGVVENGTARAIKSSFYSIAGKTGTAQIAFGNRGYVQNGLKRHQASFCGYFPADNPQYSCIVVLYTRLINKDSNFYGGTWAAPVFREITDKIFATHPHWQGTINAHEGHYTELPRLKRGKINEMIEVAEKLSIPFSAEKISEDWGTSNFSTSTNKIVIKEHTTTKTDLVPLVEGMGLKEALYVLENLGLRVSFSGKGMVLSQSIPAGQKIQNGQNITLMLGN